MLNDRLEHFGQSHLCQFENELTEEQRSRLREQVQAIDLQQLQTLFAGKAAETDWSELAARAQQPPAVCLGQSSPKYGSKDALKAGQRAIRDGQIGMILVAGGQGTRLGFDQPKGMFPVGPISNRTLFQMHIDRMIAMMKRYEVDIPVYIMTSPATDRATREYFQQNENCGLRSDLVHIFCQGTMPAVDDQTGKILLASKYEIALSPDGHGGLLAALHANGCLNTAKELGLRYFYYAQVDNPMAQLCDPELIGYHILAESEMTTQVVRKRFPTEKVGNVVSADGKVQIIEYSDLPDSVAETRMEDGSLKFWAGNIAVHVFDLAFLASSLNSADALPFHRAHKKVQFLDANGEIIDPNEPNAIKFERFIFDLLPLAKQALVVEGDPAQVFAPVKNANGAAVDTPEHTQQAILSMHRQWLLDAGVNLPEGVRVEINPSWALDSEQVQQRVGDLDRIVCDTYLR